MRVSACDGSYSNYSDVFMKVKQLCIVSNDSRVTNHIWFICTFLMKGFCEHRLLLLPSTLGVTLTSYLSLTLWLWRVAGGGGINRRWLISVNTLSLSVTCVTKHLKSLQLSCEVPTAQLKWSDVTICGRSLVVLWCGICQTVQFSRALSHLHWYLVSLI